MKRNLLSVFISLLMIISLIACSGNEGKETSSVSADSAATAESVELTLWTFPFGTDAQLADERANYDKIVADFEAENPGITVNVEILPWDNRETKMLTAIASGSGPDIMYLNPDILKLFESYGVLAPITDYISDETVSEYSASLLDGSVRLNGELYGLPVLVDLGTPVYNLELLAEIGMDETNLPETWEEYDQMLAALKEKGIYGVYYNYSASLVSNYTYAQLFSEGCDVISEDGEVVIDNDAGRKVMNRLVSWYQNGYTPSDSLSINDDDASFMSGLVASCLSPKGAGFFVRMAPDLTFEWAPGPILKGDAGQYGISSVGSFAVSKSCKNVEAAAKFIEFFTETDRLAQWDYFGGYICPKNGAESPYADLKGYGYILENLDCVRGEPNHAAARTLATVFTPDMQAMVSGSVSFDSGMEKLKTDLEGIVATVSQLSN